MLATLTVHVPFVCTCFRDIAAASQNTPPAAKQFLGNVEYRNPTIKNNTHTQQTGAEPVRKQHKQHGNAVGKQAQIAQSKDGKQFVIGHLHMQVKSLSHLPARKGREEQERLQGREKEKVVDHKAEPKTAEENGPLEQLLPSESGGSKALPELDRLSKTKSDHRTYSSSFCSESSPAVLHASGNAREMASFVAEDDDDERKKGEEELAEQREEVAQENHRFQRLPQRASASLEGIRESTSDNVFYEDRPPEALSPWQLGNLSLAQVSPTDMRVRTDC